MPHRKGWGSCESSFAAKVDALLSEGASVKYPSLSRAFQHDNVSLTILSSSEELLVKWDKGLRADILFLDILFENELDGMQAARQIRLTDARVPTYSLPTQKPLAKTDIPFVLFVT